MVLKIGDIAPDFKFIDKNGNKNNLHSVPGTKIVYFFPRAFTPTCTKESCSIRDAYTQLKSQGITEVFGISTDSKQKQDKFAKEHNLQYILVNDESKQITKDYDLLWTKFMILKMAKRFSFIVDENNQIKAFKNAGLKGERTTHGIEKHGEELLDLLTQ